MGLEVLPGTGRNVLRGGGSQFSGGAAVRDAGNVISLPVSSVQLFLRF